MRLQLINPPEIRGYISDRDKAGGLGTMFPINHRYRYRAFTPPLDLLYTAAVAERAGATVSIKDACAEHLNATALLLGTEAYPPDAIGVRLSLPSLREDLMLARALKAILPRTKLFGFGNVIQTTHASWLDSHPFDGLLFGEPEALVEDFLQEKDHPQIWTPGSAVPCGWHLQEALDHLPIPAWHLLRMGRYSPDGRAPSATYYHLTSRGCPKACSMCPYYVHQGGPWRARSLESVLAELEVLKGLGVKTLQARDPNIGLVKKRLRAIAEGMIERQLKFDWIIETDLESLDPDTIGLLARAGLKRLMTGIESADPVILREIHQHPDALKLTLRNISLCRELGIELTGFMVVGSISESLETVASSVKMVQALPMRYSVSLMTPYPGTVYRQEAERLGYVSRNANYHDLGGTACVVRTHSLDKGLLKLAYRWAQGELESVTRQRAFNSSHGAWKILQGIRLIKHALWHWPTQLRFRWARDAARNKDPKQLAGLSS